MDADQEHHRKLLTGIQFVAIGILVICLISILFLLIACYVLLQLLVLCFVWLCWNSVGKDMLVVYSNSPYWKDYFERGLLALTEDRAIVLNWSERSQWSTFSLKTAVFRLFAGGKEYNPLVMQFPFFRWPKQIRFYSAFHDSKHGKPNSLIKLEQELSSIIAQPFDLSEFHPRKSV